MSVLEFSALAECLESVSQQVMNSLLKLNLRLKKVHATVHLSPISLFPLIYRRNQMKHVSNVYSQDLISDGRQTLKGHVPAVIKTAYYHLHNTVQV